MFLIALSIVNGCVVPGGMTCNKHCPLVGFTSVEAVRETLLSVPVFLWVISLG